MARVLLAWELGGGIGHLVNLLPLAEGLTRQGHLVFAALRDLSRAEMAFRGLGVRYLQAPIKTRPATRHIAEPRTFTQILHNNGFGDLEELACMATAWRNLYEFVRPDLIVFDHSPTALLAAQARPARRALIGTGFFCPPDESPLPDLRPWLGEMTEQHRRHEEEVLQNVNRVLRSWKLPPLERISQLYSRVDENFLTTFRELDNYGRSRPEARYWGTWPYVGGAEPEWPAGDGPRIYAYLKPFPALKHLLAKLHETGHPTLVYADGISHAIQKQYRGTNVRIVQAPVDVWQVSSQCDLAILNGNHGTTAAMLLAGKPMLQLPIYLEQFINAQAVERMGSGLSASIASAEQVSSRLDDLLGSDTFERAASRYRDTYSTFDPGEQVRRMFRTTQRFLATRM